jgi:hypothetical protein
MLRIPFNKDWFSFSCLDVYAATGRTFLACGGIIYWNPRGNLFGLNYVRNQIRNVI